MKGWTGQIPARRSTGAVVSLRFDSPYDADAHYCVKRDVQLSGYRVHVTESCDQDLPHLVTHVATTLAPVQDGQMTEKIHADPASAPPFGTTQDVPQDAFGTARRYRPPPPLREGRSHLFGDFPLRHCCLRPCSHCAHRPADRVHPRRHAQIPRAGLVPGFRDYPEP